jgi:hypothetical protein
VANAELFRDGIGDVTMRLHRDHGVARIQATLVQVRYELIKRLGADPAGKAVLEKYQRPLNRRRQGALEVVHS